MLYFKQIREKDLKLFYDKIFNITGEKADLALLKACIKLKGAIMAKDKRKIVFFSFFHLAKDEKGKEFFCLLHFWLHDSYRKKLYLKYLISLLFIYTKDKDVCIQSNDDKILFSIQSILKPLNAKDYQVLKPSFLQDKLLKELYNG